MDTEFLAKHLVNMHLGAALESLAVPEELVAPREDRLVTESARICSYYFGEKRTSETPEIARFYETQAQLPSRGGPRAELDDRISKRCEESDEMRKRSATLLPWDYTTMT